MLLSGRISKTIDNVFNTYPIINDLIIYGDYYKSTNKTKLITAPIDLAIKYKGNLFGLFTEIGLDITVHMLIASFNNINNPSDYDGTTYIFYIPNVDIYTKVSNILN